MQAQRRQVKRAQGKAPVVEEQECSLLPCSKLSQARGPIVSQGALYQGDRPKVTDRAQSADFRRNPQIFADSPLLLTENSSMWRAQETAEYRRKPLIGVCHLRSVTFNSARVCEGKATHPKKAPTQIKSQRGHACRFSL